MIYVMSDLHGQYRKYLKMLETIRFTDNDDLYVLGDVVDRGPEPVELLQDMSLRTNVFPILGNHDASAAYLLKKLNTKITKDNIDSELTAEIMKTCIMWQLDDGDSTIDGFKKLTPDAREALIEYLDEFVPYEYLEVAGNRFLLVHGGVPYDKRNLPLSEQAVHELVTERLDYTKRYYDDIYLVTGHTPTVTISENYRGRIYRANGHIAIDCGAGFDMPLGCIRLDDFREFYVE